MQISKSEEQDGLEELLLLHRLREIQHSRNVEWSPSTGCCRGSLSCGILCLCTARKREQWLFGEEKRSAVGPESKSSTLGSPHGRLQGLSPGFACPTSGGSSAPNPRSAILRSVLYVRGMHLENQPLASNESRLQELHGKGNIFLGQSQVLDLKSKRISFENR